MNKFIVFTLIIVSVKMSLIKQPSDNQGPKRLLANIKSERKLSKIDVKKLERVLPVVDSNKRNLNTNRILPNPADGRIDERTGFIRI